MEAEVRINTADMAEPTATAPENRTTKSETLSQEPEPGPGPEPGPEPEPVSTPEQLYTSISKYPFNSDPEYQSGLASILGRRHHHHPEQTAATVSETTKSQQQDEDLVTQAQCFYFSRKFNIAPPVDPVGYKNWLSSSSSSVLPPPPKPTEQETAPPPPPYPTSFAAIVDLITSNKPIPGIQEIPDTVLDLGSSKRDQATRRRKPWEKDDDTNITTNVEDNNNKDETQVLDKIKSTGQGVVKILQPNAIPDSGLVAKD